METLTVFEIEADGKLTGRRYLSQGEADAYLGEFNVPESHTCRPPRSVVRPVEYRPVPQPAAIEITPSEKLICELEDRYRAETDAIRDAVDELIDLEIMSPPPWSYGAKGGHIPLPEDEARQFRVDIRSDYVVDVTGDIREQTVEALQALADDLNAAAELLEASAAIETDESMVVEFDLSDPTDESASILAEALDAFGRGGTPD